jgi:hypothetical protein
MFGCERAWVEAGLDVDSKVVGDAALSCLRARGFCASMHFIYLYVHGHCVAVMHVCFSSVHKSPLAMAEPTTVIVHH